MSSCWAGHHQDTSLRYGEGWVAGFGEGMADGGQGATGEGCALYLRSWSKADSEARYEEYNKQIFLVVFIDFKF